MLSKIPSWLWAVLVCVVIYGAGVWRGLDVVTEEYEAKIAAMNAARAEEERARAEAVAAAKDKPMRRLWRPRRGARSSPANSPRKPPNLTPNARP